MKKGGQPPLSSGISVYNILALLPTSLKLEYIADSFYHVIASRVRIRRKRASLEDYSLSPHLSPFQEERP